MDLQAYRDGVIPDGCTQIFEEEAKQVRKKTGIHEESSDGDSEDEEVCAGVADAVFERASGLFDTQRKAMTLPQKGSSSASSDDTHGKATTQVQLKCNMPMGGGSIDSEKKCLFFGLFGKDGILEFGESGQ